VFGLDAKVGEAKLRADRAATYAPSTAIHWPPWARWCLVYGAPGGPGTAPMPKLLGLYVLPPANRTREGTA
jgi:hypothetical protein